MSNTTKPEFFLALEGIRGYAFLAVFFVHYHLYVGEFSQAFRGPSFLALNLSWFLVPIFFVLSGFLITRILLATREREGFFRVFYLRRAVRVLPLYYLIVAIVAAVGVACHFHFSLKHISYLVYMQNFTTVPLNHYVDLEHFWSLAIEEQFYLLWPLVIWALRSEKALLRYTYFLIAAFTIFRIAAPFLGFGLRHAYQATPYRVDGILLGCALAIHYKNTAHWERFVRFAKIGIPVLFASIVVVMMTQGTTLPTFTYTGTAFCTPVMNLIGLAFVILALTPNTFVARVCSGRRICSFGKLTYGMYLMHEIYAPFLMMKLTPWFSTYLPLEGARWATSFVALGITVALAALAYRFVEMPMMKLKDRFRYGKTVKQEERAPWQVILPNVPLPTLE